MLLRNLLLLAEAWRPGEVAAAGGGRELVELRATDVRLVWDDESEVFKLLGSLAMLFSSSCSLASCCSRAWRCKVCHSAVNTLVLL